MTRFLLFLLLLPGLRLTAQLPSECLLIVNGSSPEALRVANEFRALRGIPSERVLTLEPARALFRKTSDDTPRWAMTETEARETLLEPVLRKLEQLNDVSPTALLFSPDWPVRVTLDASQPVSLTAFVGFLGVMPASESIRLGQARVAWFNTPEELRNPGSRLRRYPAPEMKKSGQHPAMMLGVFYEPLDAESIVAALQRSSAADFRHPSGSVAIITNTDVRSTARAHQFAPARERLESRGVNVFLEGENVPLPKSLIGVMTGAATVHTDRYKGKLVPGAFAEHLTSHAATFDTPGQTKLTRWIEAGAAGSVGTVTEPLSIWTKFPHAAVFERYLLGNTLLEALTQSIGHPFQALAVGDPLCRPWANRMDGLRLETKWQVRRLRIEAKGMPAGGGVDLHLFANGHRLEGNGPVWEKEWTEEETGPELRLQLHARHAWLPPVIGRVEQTIQTPFPSKLALALRAKGDNILGELKSPEALVRWELLEGERVLTQGEAQGHRVKFELPRKRIGEGPATLQAKAYTASGRILLSTPEDRP